MHSTSKIEINQSYWIKWAICIIAPLIILCFPTGELFTPLIKNTQQLHYSQF